MTTDDDSRIGVDVGTDLTAATAAQVRSLVAVLCSLAERSTSTSSQ